MCQENLFYTEFDVMIELIYLISNELDSVLLLKVWGNIVWEAE